MSHRGEFNNEHNKRFVIDLFEAAEWPEAGHLVIPSGHSFGGFRGVSLARRFTNEGLFATVAGRFAKPIFLALLFDFDLFVFTPPLAATRFMARRRIAAAPAVLPWLSDGENPCVAGFAGGGTGTAGAG